jgi:hypothetical protein
MGSERIGIGLAGLVLALGLASGACAPLEKKDASQAQLPYELSAEECDNLIEINTEDVALEAIEGPSEEQMALDAKNPQGADLSQYQLRFAVQQSFENLLERPMVIEEVTATLSDPEAETSYDASYDLDEPIELAARENRSLAFHVTVPADRLSGSYVLGLVEGSALGMTIAPTVRINVPDSDNCGYPEGMVVQAKQGTVEVQRPYKPGLVDEILGGILKGLLHGA